MKVFPESPIVIDSFAMARLASVAKNGRSVYGTFSIEPVSPARFMSYIDCIRPALGVRYVPVPWLWAMFRISEEEDDFLLQVGIGKVYCKAVADARRSIERKPSSVVSSEQVAFVVESMLCWMGAV